MARTTMMRVALTLLGVAVLVVIGLALSDSDDGGPTTSATTTAASQRSTPAEPPPPPLRPARCSAGAPASCVAVTGRVVAIESVDPDGDGDLHVIAAGGAVTAPGITVFDVRAGLRPKVDPRPGDRVTGAGPVYRGSHGQRQIEVTEFRVSPQR